MVFLNEIGIVFLWAIIVVAFAWMVVHYGLGQGKLRDVSREYEYDDEREERLKHPDTHISDLGEKPKGPPKEPNDQRRQVS
jgi:hypothetical protein